MVNLTQAELEILLGAYMQESIARYGSVNIDCGLGAKLMKLIQMASGAVWLGAVQISHDPSLEAEDFASVADIMAEKVR